MNRKGIILGLFLMALLMTSSLVLAQSDATDNSGKGNSDVMAKKAMELEKERIKLRIDNDRIRFEREGQLRVRINGLSEKDATLIAAVRANIDDVEGLSIADRAVFLSRLRSKISDDVLVNYTELRERSKEREELRIRIMNSSDISDDRLREIERLRIAEKISDDETRVKLVELRLKLENNTTITAEEMSTVNQRLFEVRQEQLLRKANSALEHAISLNEKLDSIILRLENKSEELTAGGRDTTLLDRGIAKLKLVNSDLDSVIGQLRGLIDKAEGENSTVEGLTTLHRAMIELHVQAQHSVNLIRQTINYINEGKNGWGSVTTYASSPVDDSSSTLVEDGATDPSLDDFETLSVEVVASIADEQLVMTSATSSSDAMESNDSGSDSVSDASDVMEDDSHMSGSDSASDAMEDDSHDSGNDSPSDLDDSDEDGDN